MAIFKIGKLKIESNKRLAFFVFVFGVIDLHEEVYHQQKNVILKILQHHLHGFTHFITNVILQRILTEMLGNNTAVVFCQLSH